MSQGQESHQHHLGTCTIPADPKPQRGLVTTHKELLGTRDREIRHKLRKGRLRNRRKGSQFPILGSSQQKELMLSSLKRNTPILV